MGVGVEVHQIIGAPDHKQMLTMTQKMIILVRTDVGGQTRG
jgi:hypothetical protein